MPKFNQPNRFRVPGLGESIVFISASVVLIGGLGWLQGWWGGDVDPNNFRIGDLASERAERLCVERYIKETGGRGITARRWWRLMTPIEASAR